MFDSVEDLFPVVSECMVVVRKMQWTKVADYAQRSVTFVLIGLTVYGTALLAKGGWGVWKRHKQRKVLLTILC